MKKIQQMAVPAALAALLATIAGCGKNAAKTEKSEFDVPPSLVDRMYCAHNEARNRMLKAEGSLDGEEMMALMMMGLDGSTIASRPRGEMSFADDGLTDERRRQLWPFDFESFEKTLEAEMERDEHGLWCLKAEDGLQPSNPTIRWINGEIEKWAVERLDAAYRRMDAKTYAEAFGEEPPEDGILVWIISEGDGPTECFQISRDEGAWNAREYFYLLWDGEEEPTPLAAFNSFPSRKEAAAMRTFLTNPASLNNMAVLYWRHRIFRLQMDPFEIREMLQLAAQAGVTVAERNLSILLEHVPEAGDDAN